MARIKKIHDIINGKLPSYNSAFLKVRGLAFPLDIFLKGKTRFSKKIGDNLAIWLPDNHTTLASSLSSAQTKAVLKLPLNWAVPGSKILLNNQIYVFIEDVVDDGYGLLLTDKSPVTIPENADVVLYGHPLEILGNYPGTSEAPIDTIIVKSNHNIYLTDEINVGTFSYTVTTSTLDPVTLPDGRFQYILQVSPGIPENLTDGSVDQAYLRAHPAYESPLLSVPTTSNTIIGSIGPFVYDRISGPFFTDMNVEETDIVTTYDTNGTLVKSAILGKNALIPNIPISADSFLFWDKVRGRIQWDGIRKAFKSITDSSGVSHITYQCIPYIDPGNITSWTCAIETTVATKMVVELEPNIKQEFTLSAGVQTTVDIQFPITDLPIERIHVLFITEEPNSDVYMRSWQMNTSTVGTLTHTTIVKVSGTSVWASSGVMVKPYFLLLAYIKAQVDLLAKLDAGLLAL